MELYIYGKVYFYKLPCFIADIKKKSARSCRRSE